MRLSPPSWRVLFYVVVIILIIINIGLLISIIQKSKANKQYTFTELLNHIEKRDAAFYNAPAPEVDLVDFQGRRWNLSSLAGDVIILKFTRFLSTELPSLIYLEHLWGRLRNYGLKIFFIYPTKRSNPWSLSERVNMFHLPVIMDDSTLVDSFNAMMNDTIIIGRDSKIKFKHNQAPDSTIYHQVVRFLEESSGIEKGNISSEDLLSNLKKISYQNMENGKIENLGDMIRGKTAFINLFISKCFGCPVGERIKMMKETAGKCNDNEGEVFFLFGRGNEPQLIVEYAERNQLFGENIKLGIIQESEELSSEDYYRLFDFEINPRLFIVNKEGKLSLAERRRNQRKLDLDYLLSALK